MSFYHLVAPMKIDVDIACANRDEGTGVLEWYFLLKGDGASPLLKEVLKSLFLMTLHVDAA